MRYNLAFILFFTFYACRETPNLDMIAAWEGRDSLYIKNVIEDLPNQEHDKIIHDLRRLSSYTNVFYEDYTYTEKEWVKDEKEVSINNAICFWKCYTNSCLFMSEKDTSYNLSHFYNDSVKIE